MIVGKAYTKTPIFTETMKLVVLNPDWTVPRSIVRNEIFPRPQPIPGYLDAHDYYLTNGKGGASKRGVEFVHRSNVPVWRGAVPAARTHLGW